MRLLARPHAASRLPSRPFCARFRALLRELFCPWSGLTLFPTESPLDDVYLRFLSASERTQSFVSPSPKLPAPHRDADGIIAAPETRRCADCKQVRIGHGVVCVFAMAIANTCTLQPTVLCVQVTCI